MTEFWTAILTLFGVGCFSWLAYKAGYAAGVEAKWLTIDAKWKENQNEDQI